MELSAFLRKMGSKESANGRHITIGPFDAVMDVFPEWSIGSVSVRVVVQGMPAPSERPIILSLGISEIPGVIASQTMAAMAEDLDQSKAAFLTGAARIKVFVEHGAAPLVINLLYDKGSDWQFAEVEVPLSW